eukprot:TRINITY_DN20532_c0_g1::TRINITY_DN20532_c0_g1_i1::g.33::m.33 TRINITY_DN20532_c0_g1::TRINITY_DN20532_c0_g1_i1::g.33  ORF type:complete len:118 (-),score=-11.29,DDE_Tnp_1_5/PF13737.1/0.04 TRINITY_DN20532_c0_g1_i1:817-1170(-)
MHNQHILLGLGPRVGILVHHRLHHIRVMAHTGTPTSVLLLIMLLPLLHLTLRPLNGILRHLFQLLSHSSRLPPLRTLCLNGPSPRIHNLIQPHPNLHPLRRKSKIRAGLHHSSHLFH